MSRYIDADALIEKARHEAKGLDAENFDILVEWLVDKTPTADVVEVVRCKDCKGWIKNEKRCCFLNHGMLDMDYCSFGERREDGEVH